MAISAEMRNAQPKNRRGNTTARHGIAFLIEALVILAFLMGCLAIFTKLFTAAQIEGIRATRQSQAIIAATNRAEEFSANPTDTSGSVTESGLEVTCDIDAKEHTAGVLYNATIIVYDQTTKGEELFRLETSRYVSGAGELA